MPNRIIKESICTSEEIETLSPFEEIFFYRLMVNCDDYGCMDARPRILTSKLFPLKSISDELVISTLKSLATANLIELYEVNDKPYLHMTSWENHQQIRAKKRKYPSKDDDGAQEISADNIGYHTKSDDGKYAKNWDDINENQMISNDSKCPRNPIQSESNPESNSNPAIARSDDDEFPEWFDDEPKEKPKKKKEKPVDETPVMFQLMLNDKTMFDVHQSLVDECKKLYPIVDVEQSFRNMIGWIAGNPTKRKTRMGINKFIHTWMAKEQDRGRYSPSQKVGANGVKLATENENTVDLPF